MTASIAMPRSRLVRSYYTEAKYETLRMLRAPGFVFPTLLLPVGLYLLIGIAIFGNAADPATSAAIFTAFATFATIGPGM